jgi:hypothetical protein
MKDRRRQRMARRKRSEPRGRRVALLLGATATLVLTVAACDEARNPVAEDTFVDVMVELHLLDARPELDDSRDELREVIFQRYDVEPMSIDSALVYYSRHPDEYSEVYARIIDRLTEESAGVR